jgi:hypothetical protein
MHSAVNKPVGSGSPSVLLRDYVSGIIIEEWRVQVSKPKRYTRAFAEAEAVRGNVNATIATNIYLTMAQLEKIDRLISKRRDEESAKLGRQIPRMTFADFIRVTIDELPEAQ